MPGELAPPAGSPYMSEETTTGAIGMDFTDAIERALLERDLPVVSFYDFFVLGHKVLTSGTWDGEPIKRPPDAWNRTWANTALARMDEKRALVPDIDFRSGVWRVVQSTRGGYAEDIICMVDPFAYVSHLSAMEYYCLTNRSPLALHVTIPRRDIWKRLRDDRARDDLPGLAARMPMFRRPGIRNMIRRRPVVVHTSSRPWTPVPLAGREARITSIGQTFADMLINPFLCGGMRHVIEIWEAEAERWVDDIVEAVHQVDSKIVKARAGYILSEVLRIEHRMLSYWEDPSPRGGSRKLDPEGEYVPKFSERWGRSLNAY